MSTQCLHRSCWLWDSRSSNRLLYLHKMHFSDSKDELLSQLKKYEMYVVSFHECDVYLSLWMPTISWKAFPLMLGMRCQKSHINFIKYSQTWLVFAVALLSPSIWSTICRFFTSVLKRGTNHKVQSWHSSLPARYHTKYDRTKAFFWPWSEILWLTMTLSVRLLHWISNGASHDKLLNSTAKVLLYRVTNADVLLVNNLYAVQIININPFWYSHLS